MITRRSQDCFLVCIFLLTLCTPVLLMLTADSEPVPRLRKKAVYDVDQTSIFYRYIRRHKEQFEENFPLRGWMIQLNGFLKVGVLHSSSSHRVIPGKHSWLFYAGEDEIPCILRTRPMNQYLLSRFARLLNMRRKWLEASGRRYLVVIIPDKHTVYPEFLPDSLSTRFGRSRAKQVRDYLREHHPGILLLHPETDIRNRRAGFHTYFQDDTHPNQLGSFRVYQNILKVIEQLVPAVKAIAESEISIRAAAPTEGDLSALLGFTPQQRESQPEIELPERAREVQITPSRTALNARLVTPLVVTRNPNGEIKSAVIFRDSFMSAVIPFLSVHFREARYFWDTFNGRLIRKNTSALVVEAFAERTLMKLNAPYLRRLLRSERTNRLLASRGSPLHPRREAVISAG